MHLSARRDQSEHSADASLPRRRVIDAGAARPYGNKSSILEICSSVHSEGPNSPGIVLKKRLHTVVRQSVISHFVHIEFSFLFGGAIRGVCASLTVNRDLPLIPSVQTVGSAKPNAAVLGR